MCNLTLGVNEAYSGVANQLIALQSALCVANQAGACALLSPIGYGPRQLHGLPLDRPESPTNLLRFVPRAQRMLERGSQSPEALQNRLSHSKSCAGEDGQAPRCKRCHSYMRTPVQCVASAQRGESVFFDRIFDLRLPHCSRPTSMRFPLLG